MQTNRGAALITALFITVLCAIVAVAMMVNQRMLIRQTELLFGYDQLYADLQGVQYWAEDVILSKLNRDGSSTGIYKTMTFPQTSFQGVTLKGHFVDAQAFYNLNALQATTNEPSFLRLQKLLGLPNTPSLTLNVNQWIAGGPNVDDYYMKLNPPRRAGHTLMGNKTELRGVKGISQAIYNKLTPWVVALPTNKLRINANTAAPVVLASLADAISLSNAKNLISCGQGMGGFQTIDQFNQCASTLNLPGDAMNALDEKVSVNTNYFLVYATATNGAQTLHASTLLQLYKDQLGKPQVSIVYQSVD